MMTVITNPPRTGPEALSPQLELAERAELKPSTPDAPVRWGRLIGCNSITARPSDYSLISGRSRTDIG